LLFEYIRLNKITLQHHLGYILIDNIQQSKEYLNIQLITKIFRFIYFVYMLFVVSLIVEDNTWSSSLKYGILLAVVYIIQNFVLTKG